MRARAKAATATTTGTAQQQLSVPKLEANNSQSNSYTLTPNYPKMPLLMEQLIQCGRMDFKLTINTIWDT